MSVAQRITEEAYERIVFAEPDRQRELYDGQPRERPGMGWEHGRGRTRMSEKAEQLADRFAETNQAIIDLIAFAPAGALRRTCDAEGWTAAAVGAHVATSHDFLIDRIRRIVEGEEFPPFDPVAFHEGNRRAAEANAELSAAAVTALLRDWTASAVTYMRGLSDSDLERGMHIPAMGDDPTSAQTMIERVLIGHTEAHLQSLRQGLG